MAANISISGSVKYDRLFDAIAVTGATNASPIVIQCASHTVLTGDRLTIAGCVGNTAANGSWTATYVDATHFSLQGSTGNGTWSSGGTVNPEFVVITGGAKAGSGDQHILGIGAQLTIDTDTRYCRNHSTATGVFGSAAYNLARNAKVMWDGTNVRLIPFNTGSGTVPATGATISQGGVTSELLGVWQDLKTRIAPAASMPSSGYIKIKSKTGGSFAAGALTGITATATGADVVGWIEVAVVNGADLTSGSGSSFATFESQGAWFEAGTTNGSRNQTMQLPNTVGNAFYPGVFIETSVGSPGADSDFEFYCNVPGRAGLYTDSRNKVCWIDSSGLLTIGYDGTANSGHLPVTGLRVVVPNILVVHSNGTNTNAFPASGVFSRARFGNSATLGDMIISKTNWNLWVYAYTITKSLQFSCSGLLTYFQYQTVLGTVSISNCGASMCDTSADSMGILTCAGTITIDKFRTAGGGGFLGISQNNQTTITNSVFLYATPRATTGQPVLTVSYCNALVVTSCTCIGGYLRLLNCTDAVITGTLYADDAGGTGVTATSWDSWGMLMSSCLRPRVSGFTLFTNSAPASGIVSVDSATDGLDMRLIGTSASPLDMNGRIVLGTYGGNFTNATVKRCYFTNCNTTYGPFPLGTAVGALVQNCAGDYATAAYIVGVGLTFRGLRGDMRNLDVSASRGCQFFDHFTSTTAGRVLLRLNATIPATAPYYSVISGTPDFDRVGQLVLATVGDSAELTFPYTIKGHTGFSNSAAEFKYGYDNLCDRTHYHVQYKLNGGSLQTLLVGVAATGGTSGASTFTVSSASKITIGDYVYGTGIGTNAKVTNISGTTITVDVVNSGTVSGTLTFNHLPGETISPAGFTLAIRITTLVADINGVKMVGIPSTTTITDQQANLYDLDTSTVSITSLVSGSRIRITKTSDGSLLLNDVCAGSAYTTNLSFTGEVRIEVRKATGAPYYKPWFTIATVGSGLSVVALQERDDL